MDIMDIPWWVPTAIGLVSVTAGYVAHAVLTRMRMTGAEKRAEDILRDAKLEAEVISKDAKVKARDEVLRAQKEFKEETRQQREEMRAAEERMNRRENNLDRKVAMLDKKEQKLEDELTQLAERRRALDEREQDLQNLYNEQQETLQRLAAMSQDEARQTLMQKMEEDMRAEAGQLLRRIQEETLENAEREAREIITTAIQRYAADQANEITTCTVNLPNDEMKGRIIGREGRNIRALEAATGVDILIDDTPEVVVISGFDPLRREVARIALERLIADGRIQPARIEEVVSKVQEEIDETIRTAGEEAIYDLGLQGVDPELVRTLGRLKFRHSYSQNVLQHSIEVAHLMAMMAGELDLDADIAKRIGLFHDLGKAIDHQVEGGHAIIGADLLRKHGEDPQVYNAVSAHHGEVEYESVYATLAAAADAMTASRPGARSENTELYLKRLRKLEDIATSFRGVEKSYAIQAGRELRVVVAPSKIDDDEALQMARNISKRVHDDLEYPGQIKVTVIRETRCIEYAR
jgi:ribonuclease Y